MVLVMVMMGTVVIVMLVVRIIASLQEGSIMCSHVQYHVHGTTCVRIIASLQA